MGKRTIHPPEIVTLAQSQSEALLGARNRGLLTLRTSRTLGLTHEKAEILAGGVAFEGAELIEWAVIETIARDPKHAYRIEKGKARAIQVFSDAAGALRVLCPTKGAPTTLIGGIPMHRMKDFDPWKDAELKAATLGEPHGNVLDTCFGLGYTTILLGRRAKSVTAFEVDPNALALARHNPWSLEAFQNPRITIQCADVGAEAAKLPTGRFDAILHDPPTIALAGDLYSLAFYQELRRALRRGGILYHYIGDPGSRVGSRHFPGVMKRLAEAGFRSTRREVEAHGVTALA